MADQSLEPDTPENQKPAPKKPYTRPALVKLGGLRDMTMGLSGGGAPDGMPARGTKRGGNFETDGCEG
jgi:hypothetical protein